VLQFLGAFGEPAVKHAYEQVLDDLLGFAVGVCPRNRAVDIALGFACTYQLWLHDERAWDREEKATRRRPPMFSLRGDENVGDDDPDELVG
jgi:hypothetical protein